jgi:hypothetical protein
MQGRGMWISSANHAEMIEAHQETAKTKQINKYTWAARITSFQEKNWPIRVVHPQPE